MKMKKAPKGKMKMSTSTKTKNMKEMSPQDKFKAMIAAKKAGKKGKDKVGAKMTKMSMSKKTSKKY